MVKFGRKFFFDSKHSKKRGILWYVIVAAIAIFLLFILALIIRTIKHKPKTAPSKQIVIREKLTTGLYEELPDKTAYFKKLSNFDIEDIKVTYPDYLPLEENYDNCTDEETTIIEEIKGGKSAALYENPYACVTYVPTAIGSYDVTVNYNNKDYTVVLNVKDQKAPVLVTKNVEITEGEKYKVTDFVESCVDNSKKECSVKFYSKEYNDNKIDFENITEIGTHEVAIVAYDDSNNQSLPVNATLIIKEKPQLKVFTVAFNSDGGNAIDSQSVIENEKATAPNNPSKSGYTFTGWYLNGNKFDFNTPITGDITLTAGWNKQQAPATGCSTGDMKYDANKYPYVAVYVSNGNCPVSKSDFTSVTYQNKAKMVLSQEVTKLRAWQDSIGTEYCVALVDGKPQGVLNLSGKGYVGYTIQISVAKAPIINGECQKNGAVEMARYYLDSNGVRHFSLNLINMPER